MKNNSPKYIAHKTLIKHKQYLFNNYNDLKRIIETYQFTIIEFKKHTNSEPVSELIKRLMLETLVEQNDSFIYVKNNLKFVFLNKDIPEEDKCSLLRHELGHICDPQLRRNMQDGTIKKEEFANEFSFYAKNPGIFFKIYVFIIKKWKLLASIFSLIACILCLSFMLNFFTNRTNLLTRNASSYEISNDSFYVTSAGKKYHREYCITIKYKNNLRKLTLNELTDYGYKPCLVCNPDKN